MHVLHKFMSLFKQILMLLFEHCYINNSLHLARKYTRIFVRGHYLFREANSFPRAKLEENCELRVYYPSVLKIGEYPRIFPSFSWGVFAHVTRLDQSRASENI